MSMVLGDPFKREWRTLTVQGLDRELLMEIKEGRTYVYETDWSKWDEAIFKTPGDFGEAVINMMTAKLWAMMHVERDAACK